MKPHRTLMRLVVALTLVGQITSWRISNSDLFDEQDARHTNRSQLISSSTGWRQVGASTGLGPAQSGPKSAASPRADLEVVSVDQKSKATKPRADKSAATPSVQWDDENVNNETGNDDDDDDDDNNNNNSNNSSSNNNSSEKERAPNKKHSNTLNATKPTSSSNLFGAANMLEAAPKFSLKSAHATNKFRHAAPYDGPPKYSKALFGPAQRPSGRLIYHGRLPASGASNSSRVQRRVVATGLEVQIDTHKPVAITRFNPADLNLRTKFLEEPANSLFMFRSGSSARAAPPPPPPPPPLADEHDKSPMSQLVSNGSNSLQEQSASSSDWRPIVVVSSRMRRSGKTQNHNAWESGLKAREAEQSPANNKTSPVEPVAASSPALESKWRPLTGSSSLRSAPEKPDGAKRADKSARSSSSWTAFRADPSRSSNSISKKSGLDVARNIEQPFDRDDELELLNQRDDDADSDRRGAPRSAELARLNPADRWRPLQPAATSKPDDELLGSSSTLASAAVELTTSQPIGGASNSTTNETAQKSASDLSYIYSSQPEQQPLVQQQLSTGSYYGQPQVQQQVQAELPAQPIGSAIVDTTSGQAPEMVPDRTVVESYPARSPYGTYSDLQTISFPPAQPPVAQPARQQLPAYYGGPQVATSGVNLADSGAYYQPGRSAVASQQPARQPVRELVRQEHHHHYYNQPSPSQSADRQQVLSPAPTQPTVIRELQPIMISQPAVVQPSGTTAAPPPPTQIIREIIKEVPMQTVQVQPVQVPTRFVVQQVPAPPQIPVIPPINLIREMGSGSYESSASYGIAPAKRFMRQLTESMPQVAIRMPAPSQFRLQVPTIQTLRSAASPSASMTRQTGSFVVPPRPKKTTTLMTETQEIPLHTTIIHSTEYTPATRTTVYTTDHQSSRR